MENIDTSGDGFPGGHMLTYTTPDSIQLRLRYREITIHDVEYYVRGVLGIVQQQQCFVSFREDGRKLEVLIKGGEVKIWHKGISKLLKFVGCEKVITNFSGDDCPHCGCEEQRYRIVIE